MAIRASILSFCALLCLSEVANADLVPPTSSIAGRSQNDWAEAWWQWATDNPVGSNPIADTTGALSHLGNQGDVFFLAGTFGADPISRTVTVLPTQTLFFPIINAITWREFSLYDDLTRDVTEFLGDPSGLYVTLDGAPLATASELAADYLQQSPDNFDFVVRTGDYFNTAFGVAAATYPSQQRGWWAALAPLAPGTYTLRFGGTTTPKGGYAGLPPASQNITYTITVVPEPSSALLATTALVITSGLQLRRRRRSS